MYKNVYIYMYMNMYKNVCVCVYIYECYLSDPSPASLSDSFPM